MCGWGLGHATRSLPVLRELVREHDVMIYAEGGAAALLAWDHRLAGTSLGVLFCTRELFARSGGFDERLVAGEDNDLNSRLHRLGGRRIYLGRTDAYTSMRRFERLGYLRTNLAWLRGYLRPSDRYQVVR